MTPEYLEKMSSEECSIARYVLQQYSWYLQRAHNKERATARWAEESITKMIAPAVGKQPGYSYQERRASAIRLNEAAAKLDAIRVNAELRATRIEYLAPKIEEQAKVLGYIHMRRKE